MHPKDRTTNNQTWQANLDQRLARRLTRPLVQPGVIGRRLPQDLLARMQRMTARLPLLPGLLRRWSPAGDLQTGPLRPTFLSPPAQRPPTTNLQGPRPFATDSDRSAADTGSLVGHQFAEKVQRPPTKAGGPKLFNKQMSKQVLVARQDSYRSGNESKPTAGTAPQPAEIQSNFANGPGSNHPGGHPRRRVADRPAEPIIQSKAISAPAKPLEKGAKINSRSADHQPHRTDVKSPVFFKKSTRQAMVFSGGYSRSTTKSKEPSVPGPTGIGTRDAVGTTTPNNNFDVSIRQPRPAANRGLLPSPPAAISSQPTAKDEPKAFAGSGIQLVWRKSRNDPPPGSHFSAGTQTGLQTPSSLNIGPAGDRLLSTAPPRTSADRARAAPGPQQSSESIQPIAENESNEAAEIDLPKLARQVSRLISRQLLVGLERRGIGRWP